MRCSSWSCCIDFEPGSCVSGGSRCLTPDFRLIFALWTELLSGIWVHAPARRAVALLRRVITICFTRSDFRNVCLRWSYNGKYSVKRGRSIKLRVHIESWDYLRIDFKALLRSIKHEHFLRFFFGEVIGKPVIQDVISLSRSLGKSNHHKARE